MSEESMQRTILEDGSELIEETPPAQEEESEFSGWDNLRDEEEPEPEPEPEQETEEVEEAPAAEEPPEEEPVAEAEPEPKPEPEPERREEVPTPQVAELPDQAELREKAVEAAGKQIVEGVKDWDDFYGKMDEHLPRLLGEVQVRAYEMAYSTIMNQLPQVIKGIQQSSDGEKAVEDAFFKAWPGLNGVDRNELRSLAVDYRRMNPNVSQEQAIKEVGTLAAVRKGIPLEDAAGIRKKEEPKPKPFKPSSRQPAAIESPMNEFEELGLEIERSRGLRP